MWDILVKAILAAVLALFATSAFATYGMAQRVVLGSGAGRLKYSSLMRRAKHLRSSCLF